MHPMTLRGGTPVPAGVYRQLHSGRLVYLGIPSTLPGQSNSDFYVKVPAAALFGTGVSQTPYFHAAEHQAKSN